VKGQGSTPCIGVHGGVRSLRENALPCRVVGTKHVVLWGVDQRSVEVDGSSQMNRHVDVLL
jgi:hypothetical protein